MKFKPPEQLLLALCYCALDDPPARARTAERLRRAARWNRDPMIIRLAHKLGR